MKKEKSSIIIEFTGKSGSGKTFLCQRIAERLLDEGLPVKNRANIQIKDLPYSNWLNLSSLFRCYSWALETQPRTLKDLILVAWRWYKLQAKIGFFRSKEGIFFLDEGFLHRFRLIRRRSKNHKLRLSEVWNDRFEMTDLLIVVKADGATMKRRRHARSGRPFKIKTGDDAYIDLPETMDDVAFYKKSIPGFDYIVVYNGKEDDPELAVEEAVKFIKAKLSEGIEKPSPSNS